MILHSMKIISGYERTFVILLLVSITTGCGNNPKKSEDSKYLECLSQYQIAFQECNSFFSYIKNQMDKDIRLGECLKKKGFPRGSDSCI
jgi:hypothetical protein